MTHAPLGSYLNMLGGLVVLLLGVLVLVPRPRTRAGMAFSVFAAGVGSLYFVSHAIVIVHAPDGIGWVSRIVANAVWVGGALAMLVAFPRPLTRGERPLLATSLLVVGLLAAPLLVGGRDAAHSSGLVLVLYESALTIPLLYALFLVLSLRFARSDDAAFRRQTGFAAGGLALFVGFQAGGGIDFAGETSLLRADGATFAAAAFRLATVLLAAGLWVASTRGPEARLARNVALITLATTLAGLLSVVLALPGGHGVARVLMALVLAYAILRHQLLGIDVKVRWTLSKSTVAAVFIAVFFVASEAAQQFFGETLGSAYVGIAAAGMLVFAIAPLQRVAERLAERAVPVAAAPIASPPRDDTVDAYRVALRRFLVDGRPTAEEELALARIATHERLTPEQALRVRHDVEGEIGRRSA